LRIFEYLYFSLSISGIILAIGYPKTGALISLVGTIEQKVYEKTKDYWKEKESFLEESVSCDLEEVVVHEQSQEGISEEISLRHFTTL